MLEQPILYIDLNPNIPLSACIGENNLLSVDNMYTLARSLDLPTLQVVNLIVVS